VAGLSCEWFPDSHLPLGARSAASGDACLDETASWDLIHHAAEGLLDRSATEFPDLPWRKSNYGNGQANCVQVATATGGHILAAVRDSKTPDTAGLISSVRALASIRG